MPRGYGDIEVFAHITDGVRDADLDDDGHLQVDVLSGGAGSGVNGSVTLSAADTAYAVPSIACTKNHILILYNGSDTDMYVGYENINANGILLPSGGVMNFDLGPNQQVYAYCGSAGKVITYSYKEIN